MDARSEISETLRRLSAAWRGRRYEELGAFFDEGVVLVLPGFSGRLEGRDALVASYRDFMEGSTVQEYREDAPNIDVWGDTAVASYRWEMVWASHGKAEQSSGHDVFVFSRGSTGDRSWRAVWRTLALDSSAS